MDHYEPRHMRRSQTSVVVTTSSTKILGPNPHRLGVIISAPNANATDQVPATQVANANTATTGVKLTFTVPAGAQAFLVGASSKATAVGGQTNSLQVIHAGVTVNIIQPNADGTWTGNIPLVSGDVVQWNTTSAVAGSTADLMLGIIQTQGFGRMTISTTSPAVIDQGINQYPGQTPLILDRIQLGDALTEDIFAISASGSPTIGIIDLFG